MEVLKLEEEMRYLQRKYAIFRDLEKVVVNEGYTLIEPALFEEYENFIKINKRVKKESMVKVLNGDGTILILRPDATTSIIKQVVPSWEQGLKLKLFYNTTTYHSTERTIEESCQFGIEYFGEQPDLADIEVTKLVFNVLKRFNVSFIVEIGNSKFLNALIAILNLEEDIERELKEYIYYKNQYEIERLVERLTVSTEEKQLILKLLSLQGDLNVIEDNLKGFHLTLPMKEAIQELKQLQSDLIAENIIEYARFDLAMLSQYDYYDGITFKGYYPNTPKPILSGGRYDRLTKRFGNNIPAIGFSMNCNEFIKEVMKRDE